MDVALQVGGEQSWGSGSWRVMLGAGWADMGCPCSARSCRADPSSPQELPNAAPFVRLELILFSLENCRGSL